ncbi:hypothetical protein CMV_026730, partial [Castanea mollissima]
GDSQVQIHDVKYRNIRGTSSSKLAVAFDCSKSKPCEKIELKEINLSYHGVEGPVASSCVNAKASLSSFLSSHLYKYLWSWDKTLKVWRLSDLKCLESIKAHDDAINGLVASNGMCILLQLMGRLELGAGKGRIHMF